MKPRTKLQKEVFDLSKHLDNLTHQQKEWAYQKCLDHKGFATKNRVICMDCGETFSTNLVNRKRATCPHCKTKIKVENTRKSTDRQIVYFALAEVHFEYQVVRNYELISHHKKGEKVHYFLHEILQYWITPDEKVEMVGLLHHTQGYCDSWGGTWAIRKNPRARYYWNGLKYKIYPDRYLPESVFKKKYSLHGINHKLDGLMILDAIRIVPHNPHAETLLKAKQYDFLYAMKDYPKDLSQYWSSIKICLRNKYKVKDVSLWKDYINLLRYFNRDIRNAKYVCPKNLKKEHDRFLKKRRNIERKLDIERKRKRAKESQKVYAKQKKAFMGLSFSKGNIQVRFLNSVQEVMEEGDTLKHCVFVQNYHEKDTLLFSALVDGEKTATVEVNPDLLEVVQIRGDHNNPTEHDKKIKAVVEMNMSVIAEKAKRKSELKTAS